MAQPNSPVAICNLAMDWLMQANESTITSIFPPTTNSEVICARWYDVVRRGLLRRHPWNFATKRVILTASTDVPAYGYTLAYNLPNDFLRVLIIGEDDFSTNPIRNTDFVIENGQILTRGDSGEDLKFLYIYNFESVVNMDASFVDLFAIDLALRIAYKFTSSNTNVERLEKLRDKFSAEAQSVDGQERPPKRIERSRALTVRTRIGGSTFEGGTRI